jgi:hypothetical protein
MAILRVNSGIWNDASEEERQEIKAILVASRLIKPKDEIVGDDSISAVYDSDDAADADNVGSVQMVAALGACKSACKAARDAARAACGVKYPLSSRKRRKCREAVEKAYQGCVAACDEFGEG